DVMLDVLLWAKRCLSSKPSEILGRLGLTKQRYLLATVHRSENTDDLAKLSEILDAFHSLDEPVVFPVHPRARQVIERADRPPNSRVKLIDPVGYLDMVTLSEAARLILTDSGGLQKEAYWLGVPCLTLRDETEWVETVEAGWNTLLGADKESIVGAVRSFSPGCPRPALYGDGFAAVNCVNLIGDISSPITTNAPYAHRILSESNHAKRTAQEVKN
ncbi:MAG: UDP-N-acetylglucosamine 2-epimerase, partial [Terriglobales bacterium]